MSGEIPWLDSGSVGSAVLKGITIGMLTAILLPAPWRCAVKRFTLAFLLPSTKDERRWWWIVSLTAGICEEALYGGFVLHYFQFLGVSFELDTGAGASVGDFRD